MIQRCVPCLSTLPAAKPEPLKMTEISGVRETVHVDVCGPFPDGVSIVGVIDQCSRYPMIYPLTSTKATPIIKRLERCFFDMGVPKKIISDKDPSLPRGSSNSSASSGVSNITRLFHYGQNQTLR